jgi:hypothetical protein
LGLRAGMPSEFAVRESGTSREQNEKTLANRPAVGKGLPLLEVLDRLAAGANLSEVMAGTGLSDNELRACFGNAADRIRQSGTAKGANEILLDWREVTLPEALEIIADHAISKRL